MAFDLESLTHEKRFLAPRIIILGPEKIGKSTFAAGADSPVFVPMAGEEGIDDLEVAKWPAPARTYKDVLEALGSLYQGEHKHRTAVLDSASTLEPILWKRTCQRCPDKHGNILDNIEKVHGGYSKGYTEVLTEWDAILGGLDALRATKNMMTIIIGHVRVRKFNDPSGADYDQYQFDVNDKAANKLFRWADSILFCNTKTHVKEQDAGFGKTKGKGKDAAPGQRFLYTQKRPSHPGGGRGVLGRLPYELPLSWTAFQRAIVEQMQAEQREGREQ